MTEKPIVVVLGKASFRNTEAAAMMDFGHALFTRDKQLLTTHNDGATVPIRDGFAKAGGKTQFLKQGDLEPFDGRYPVVVFTDKRMQDQLDKRMPDWRSRNWIIIHNPKETAEAGRRTRELLIELGTPLPDGG